MRTNPTTTVVVSIISIDIGKTHSTYSVSTSAAPSSCSKSYNAVSPPANQCAPLPDRHGGLPWRAPDRQAVGGGRARRRLVPARYVKPFLKVGMRRHGALLTVGRPGALRRCELVGLDAVSPADGTGFVAVDERGIARMPHGPQRLRHRTNADAPRRGKTRKDARAVAALFSGHSLRGRNTTSAAANELPSYRIQIHTRTNRRIWRRAIPATATGGKEWVEGVGF
jgi:hypothetical protein